VPSARVAGEELFLERLEQAEATAPVLERLEQAEATAPVLGLRQAVGSGGIEPELLWALGRECGVDIQVDFAQASPYAYDVLCVPRSGDAAPILWSVPPRRQTQPLSAFANTLTDQWARHDLAEGLRRHLRSKLPDYMIPASFIWLNAIPLTPHGKLNHRALPQPSQERASGNTVYAAPETPLHEQIVQVWKTVLGIDGFGIDANFFNIGGHSLMATQVVSRLSDLLNIEIPLRLMFEQPTIRGLAEATTALLRKGDQPALPPILPVQDGATDALDLDGLTDEEVEHLLMSLAAQGDTQQSRPAL
jgi:acyl carrier protein